VRAAYENAARIAENFGPSRPLLATKPHALIQGRWEGEQAASANIAAAIRSLATKEAATQVPAEKMSSATDEAMVRACRDLPEFYEVRVELENGCGCVVWCAPDGTKHNIEGEGYLSDDINEAIDAALAHAAAPSTTTSNDTSALGGTGGDRG
jgi:hypothetical protein